MLRNRHKAVMFRRNIIIELWQGIVTNLADGLQISLHRQIGISNTLVHRIFGDMNRENTDLSLYNNSWYKPGGGLIKRALWYRFSSLFVNSRFPLSGFKIFLLRLFGAKIGTGCVVKPNVNVKYPWNLQIGNNTWIGEHAWIDNLTTVTIGNNCCISQGGFLLTGNHDYASKRFDLIIKPITLEDGAWVGAKSVVCPGVTMKSHSVLAVGSIATSDLEEWSIYQGNPAVKVKDRTSRVESK